LAERQLKLRFWLLGRIDMPAIGRVLFTSSVKTTRKDLFPEADDLVPQGRMLDSKK